MYPDIDDPVYLLNEIISDALIWEESASNHDDETLFGDLVLRLRYIRNLLQTPEED
jgi:hypothetical protein